jgi:hypothetical protein
MRRTILGAGAAPRESVKVPKFNAPLTPVGPCMHAFYNIIAANSHRFLE